jgi:hypothetical protein
MMYSGVRYCTVNSMQQSEVLERRTRQHIGNHHQAAGSKHLSFLFETYIIIMCIVLVLLLLLLLVALVTGAENNVSSSHYHQSDHYRAKSKMFPIVYVYTILKESCGRKIPAYIKESLQHVVLTQPDCDVYLASNFNTCPTLKELVGTMHGVKMYNLEDKPSERTKKFILNSTNLFPHVGSGDRRQLWLTATHRFFYLEDIMHKLGFLELLHVEADNLIYGQISSVLPELRSNYRGLAVTPLNQRLSFLTASVLWVNSTSSLSAFNDFLEELANPSLPLWKQYLAWLKAVGWAKGADEMTHGVQPFAINEMSMLAFYRQLRPDILHLLPVVAPFAYGLHRYVMDLNLHTPTGKLSSGLTGVGIWDPNSWGQYLGGTDRHRGRDKGFTDVSHSAGQSVRLGYCKPVMTCANRSWFSAETYLQPGFSEHQCLTAPFVNCSGTLTPLWNLHVHSKNMLEFRSAPCVCGTHQQS